MFNKYSIPVEKGLFLTDFDGENIKKENIVKVLDNRPQIFESIQKYGRFICKFECIDSSGVKIHISVSEFEQKKYFIVQHNNNLSDIFEI